MQLCVLGRIAVVNGDREHILGVTREAALLADLIVHAGQLVASSRLVEDLWRGVPSPGAATTLQTYVKNLRRRLEPGRDRWSDGTVLSTVRPGYVLRLEPDAVDAWCCERLVAATRAALPSDPGRAAGLAREALGLCRGPAFGPLATEQFLEAEAARLDELQLVAFELRVEADLALGGDAELAGELQAVTAANPYRESLWRSWMLALYRAGRQADTLRAYQRLRRRLADDLGIEPGSSLRELEIAILQQRPELDPPAVPSSPIAVVPAPGAAPPLVELAGAAGFVGRHAELDVLVDLLRPPAAGDPPSLVVVTGPGGVGKTRVARRVAAVLHSAYPGGASVIELVAVSSDAAVADVVLTALGGERGQRGALDALTGVGTYGRRLVVLDNCEHVVPAAGAVAAALLAGGCSVLATSRAPLGVAGERLVPLIGLGEADAVELFLAVAGRVGGADDLTAQQPVIQELCRRLDGLPLAIELAAARSRSLAVADMIGLLGERFRLLRGDAPDPRHRTLRDAVQWSYNLLEPVERELFARLSVFRGGCDLAAATAVAGAAGADQLDVLDVLDRLVARSMVVADVHQAPTRYGSIETLREFAAEQLAPAEAVAIGARHADHHLALAESAAAAHVGTDPGPACRYFEREWHNLRAAVEWSVGRADVERAVRLVAAVAPYASSFRRLEVHGWCERVLDMPGADEHPAWSSVAASGVGFRRDAGDLAGANDLTAWLTAHDEAAGAPAYRRLVAQFMMAWSQGRVLDAAALIPPLQASAPTAQQPEAEPVVAYFRVLTALLASSDDPVVVADEAWEMARRSRRPHALALANLGLLAVDVRVADGTRRAELFDEVLRWSALFGDKVIPKNAALWMIQRETDEPETMLSFLRPTLVAARDQGQWATIDVTLKSVVPSLVALGRTRVAATVLGGIELIESSLFDDHLWPLEQAESTLRAELGPELGGLRRVGRAMTRAELLALVLTEIDAALGAPPDDAPQA